MPSNADRPAATPARQHVRFMLSPAGVDWVDAIGHANGANRSEVLRCSLAVARRHEAEVIAAVLALADTR